MKRKIIKIDESKCNGCGMCAEACHEGAIEMIAGVARLTREDYCDGLGDCLPACPTGAITFEERDALSYNEAAVLAAKAAKAGDGKSAVNTKAHTGCQGTGARLLRSDGARADEAKNNAQPKAHTGCPGTGARLLDKEDGSAVCRGSDTKSSGPSNGGISASRAQSRLMQWPCQIKLVPINAPYLNGADLLVAADCTAYAYASFHEELMRGRITLVGCPKLDEGDYAVKLCEIFERNDVRSVTVARMEVPCCGGLESAVRRALLESGKLIPSQVVTISTDGRILR